MYMTDEYVNKVLYDAQQLLWSGSLHEVDEAHNMIAKLINERCEEHHIVQETQE